MVGPARPPPCAHCGRLRKSGGVIGVVMGCVLAIHQKVRVGGGRERERVKEKQKSKSCVNGFFCFVFYLCVRTGAQVRG